MKKIATIILALFIATSLLSAAEAKHSIGLAEGLFMNFGNAIIEDKGSRDLVLTAGIASSPIYDITIVNDSKFAYGGRARLDVFTTIEDSPRYVSMDLFVGPKATVCFSDSVRLNLALGGVIGCYSYERQAKKEVKTSEGFTAGFGPDLYLDIDFTDSFGMGLGYVGAIHYDLNQGFEDRAFVLSSDIYISGYYTF